MILTIQFSCSPETVAEMKSDFGQKCMELKEMIEMVQKLGGFGLPDANVKLRWLFDGGKARR